MRRFFREIHAEMIKMKHTFLIPFHLLIPILGSSVFLMYYRFANWSEINQISGYVEMIGIALPFVISIVCAGNIRLEEQNHFQILLGSYEDKWKGFAVKCLVLMGMGFLAISGAVVLFGTGSQFISGKDGVSLILYMQLAVILFLGSIPLYLEHLFLNLVFPGTVSQCAGVAQSLLSALFLTGLGEGRWQFFPCTWSARGTMLAFIGLYQEEMGRAYFSEVKRTVLVCLLLLVLICAIIGIWFHYYEGRHCND